MLYKELQNMGQNAIHIYICVQLYMSVSYACNCIYMYLHMQVVKGLERVVEEANKPETRRFWADIFKSVTNQVHMYLYIYLYTFS